MAMRNLKYKISAAAMLAFALICFCRTFANADFDDVSVSARVTGMGSAFVGLADDSYALYHNPAGLGYLRRSELAADYQKLYLGLSDNSNIYGGYFAFVYPVKIMFTETKSVEESSTTVTTSRIQKTRDLGTFGIGWKNFGLEDVYSEDIFSIGWGRRFGENFSGGCALKFLREKYTQDLYTKIDPVFDYGTKNGLDAFSSDLGLLYNPGPRIFCGLVIMDVNEPDIGLKEKEKLPMSIKTGIAYKRADLKMTADIIKKEDDLRAGCGAEKWVFGKLLGLRAGLIAGSRDLRSITAGISSEVSNMRVDYGFRFPLSGIEETSGSHQMSFVFRFGLPSEGEVEPGSVEAELIQLRKERAGIILRLHDAIEMRDKIEQVLIEESLMRVRAKIEAAEKELKYEKEQASKPDSKIKSARTARTGGIKTHVIKKGETLQSIATHYYGNSRKWMDIFNANKEVVGRGGRIKPGNILIIPNIEEKGSEVKRAIDTNVDTESRGETPQLRIKEKTAEPVKEKKTEDIKTNAGPEKRTHTVGPRDTLRAIAEKYYGDASKWKDIYMANKNKINMGRVEEGTVLVIP